MEYLENQEFKVLMPAFGTKRNQLTTYGSNQSLLLKEARWSIESLYGDIKHKNKLLLHKLDNKLYN